MKNSIRHCFKLSSVPVKDKDFNGMAFGRQIEHFRKIEAFKADPSTKQTRFDQKGKTFAAGLYRFKKLYKVKEFYTIDRNGPNWKDDSTEIWYTSED